MIKVLADKVLGFTNGDIDKQGNQVMVKTTIGFCELPDWVGETEYYKLALKDGSLKAFTSPGESEEVLKSQEKLQALQDEIKALEEKRDLLNVPDATTDETPVEETADTKKKTKE